MMDYLMHSHSVSGATNTGALMPGAMAAPFMPALPPPFHFYIADKATAAQTQLNLLLSD
jgi:hypothetical protein